MVEAGVALVVLGAALLVAEAHVPSGLLGAAGGLALAGGAALALAGLGGGTVARGRGRAGRRPSVSGLWLGLAASKSLEARRLRSVAGREALSGRMGVVRSWEGTDGQVFVDGALWRARPSWPDEPQPRRGKRWWWSA